MKPIEVCLTADIEFTINGALNDPDQRSPLGSCCVFRQRQGISQGLAPLLAALERNKISATFFVEVMQTCYFGNSEMARVIEQVRRSDCLIDIQMHLHPEWRMLATADWRSHVKNLRKNGSMAGRRDEAKEIIADGYQRFISLTGEIPVALRTGGLHVDLNVLRTQGEIGIPLSSSVGVGTFRPSESDLHLLGGLKHVDTTTELPVFSFALNLGGREWPRLLTIIGNSFTTIRAVLEWAYAQQVGPVTILTHASEFARETKDDPVSPKYAANPIVWRRWNRLCAYLAENRTRFKTVTFRESLDSWTERQDTPVPQFSRNVLAEIKARAVEHTHALLTHR